MATIDAVKAQLQSWTDSVRARSVLLGERLNTTGLERNGLITTTPLSFKAGSGLVVVFRYGVAVLIGLSAEEEDQVLSLLADHVVGIETSPEEESVLILVRPTDEERISPNGSIQISTASTDHILVIADALAKSVALVRDERQVALVFDAIEPLASGLASRGRTPGGRGVILRMIGHALLVQHRLSGRVAVREKPDILWDRPDLERLYSRLEDEYELIERAESIDRKLVHISDAAAAFIDLQDAERSLRLEIAVVVLIVAELALALFQFFSSRH